jgi:hypothetical protein
VTKQRAGLDKGLKKTVEKDLCLIFFVARDVPLTPCDEFSEFFPARHGDFLHEKSSQRQ